MDLVRRKRGARPIAVGGLLAALGSAGCQIVFGLDDYTTGEPAECAEIAPPKVDATGSGIRGIRRLDAMSDPIATEIAPGAYCSGSTCFIFFQRRAGAVDQLMCSRCADLSALDCDPPVIVAPGVPGLRNPSVRTGKSPQLWFVNGPSQIQHAAIDPAGSCTVGAIKPIPGVLTVGSWPVVSPNGKVLVYAHGAPSRIFVARSDAAGSFNTDIGLAGLRLNAGMTTHDLRPMPVWLDDGEAFNTIYFSSTRLGTDPAILEELDVFVAHRSVNMPFDAPFEDVKLMEQLAGPGTDFPPTPISPTQWLWNFGRAPSLPDSDLYLIDVGLSPLFGPPLTKPFAAVNTVIGGEDGPALDASHLFFARTQATGPSRLFTASIAVGIGAPTSVADLGTPAGAAERDPFPLPDGRLLFVSNRSGVPKIWIKTPGGMDATRATTAFEGTTEGTPFVDEAGMLWLSWDGGTDPGIPVIARARPMGSSWGEVTEVPGLGHAPGIPDESPRLLAGGRTLVFASARPGGFFPGASTIWAVGRPDSSSDAWAPAFPIPELSTVNGVTGPFPSPDGCSITVASVSRSTSFSRDLASSMRASP